MLLLSRWRLYMARMLTRIGSGFLWRICELKVGRAYVLVVLPLTFVQLVTQTSSMSWFSEVSLDAACDGSS